MESDVTRSIGKGVPYQTERNLAKIKNIAEINNKFPIITLTESFIFHPIQLHPLVIISIYFWIYYIYAEKIESVIKLFYHNFRI